MLFLLLICLLFFFSDLPSLSVSLFPLVSKSLFHNIDDDGSGVIGNDELRNGLKEHVGIELTDEEFRLCLNVVDRAYLCEAVKRKV